MKALLPSPSVFLLILTITATFCRAAYVPEQVSIQIEVTLQKDPPSISLQWEHTPVAELASSIPTKQFYVYRCDDPFNPSQDCFQDIQEINMEEGANTYNFTDTNVQFVGSTTDWLTKPVTSPIQFHYKNYFVDWDTPNNYLRSTIAGSHGLSVMYSSRPHAYFHHLNTGSHLGKSARLTLTQELKYHAGYYANIVCQTLLGDPTLRKNIVAPPKNIQRDSSEINGVKLSCEASSDEVLGYHVYRSSTSIEGPFTRITDNIVSEATFTDSSAVNGNNYYMVRAIQLMETPATTFYNPSQAAFFSTNFVAPPQSPSQSDSPKPIIFVTNAQIFPHMFCYFRCNITLEQYSLCSICGQNRILFLFKKKKHAL